MRIGLLTATSILFSGTLLHAGQIKDVSPAESFSRVNGVPYAQGKFAPLLANMYVPKGASMAPAIIFIHGGGWTAGTRDFSDKVIDPLAEHGYVGMSIDYDLSPIVRFPVALEECKAAVRWLRAHAAEYHVDPDRIAVAGYSAGGELAALVALTGDDPRYDGIGDFTKLSSSVKAAILYSSDLDLTAFSEKDQSINAYLGGSCSEHRDLCLQASPQHNLGGNLPPIFIGHGNADEDVPYSQFTNFVAAYKQAHGPITSYTAEQGQHDYVVQPRWYQACMDATLKFLQKNL
jgi:acetyl esterase/lipase